MNVVVVTFGDGSTQVGLVLRHIVEPTVQLLSSRGTEFLVLATHCREATEAEVREFWKEKLKNAEN